MPTADPAGIGASETYPDFDLHSRYDDPGNPTEVTVYPIAPVDDVTTTWLSIDADHAVPIEAVR